MKKSTVRFKPGDTVTIGQRVFGFMPDSFGRVGRFHRYADEDEIFSYVDFGYGPSQCHIERVLVDDLDKL